MPDETVAEAIKREYMSLRAQGCSKGLAVEGVWGEFQHRALQYEIRNICRKAEEEAKPDA